MGEGQRSRRSVLYGSAITITMSITGCLGGGGGGRSDDTDPSGDQPVAGSDDGGSGQPAWMTTTLTDVRTGDPFTIAEFSGSPVLLEFFAAWCPVCTRQQRQLVELKDQLGDGIVLASLNTDPNEDADRVRAYLENHGFDWRFAVIPPEMSQALVDQFGRVVTAPPKAPVIRVCGDGTAAVLRDGVKPADELADGIAANC